MDQVYYERYPKDFMNQLQANRREKHRCKFAPDIRKTTGNDPDQAGARRVDELIFEIIIPAVIL